MKKIGFFLSFGLGGGDKTVYNLIRGLREIAMDELKFVFFYNNWSFPDPKAGPDQQTAPCTYAKYKEAGIELVELTAVSKLNEYELDLFVVTRGGDETWLLPNFERTWFNFKVIEINFHGFMDTKADCRVFPSNTLVQFKRLEGLKHAVIYNPIIAPLSTDTLRTEMGLGARFVYGRVARNAEDIYSPLSLMAYKEIETQDTALLYVNPSQSAMRDAQALGLTTVVFCTPTTDDELLSRIYNTMDVFCHSNSKGETFGNGIAEAMMHGLPVVSHIGVHDWPQAQIELLRLTGHPEQFIDSGQYRFDPDNEEDMKAQKTWLNIVKNKYAAQMRKLKDDSEYYGKVSAGNIKTAAENFHYLQVCSSYISLFFKVTGE